MGVSPLAAAEALAAGFADAAPEAAGFAAAEEAGAEAATEVLGEAAAADGEAGAAPPQAARTIDVDNPKIRRIDKRVNTGSLP
jgi:hypothetical protein